MIIFDPGERDARPVNSGIKSFKGSNNIQIMFNNHHSRLNLALIPIIAQVVWVFQDRNNQTTIMYNHVNQTESIMRTKKMG